MDYEKIEIKRLEIGRWGKEYVKKRLKD